MERKIILKLTRDQEFTLRQALGELYGACENKEYASELVHKIKLNIDSILAQAEKQEVYFEN